MNAIFGTKEGFQIDSGQMALSANEKMNPRAQANHIAAWKNQFETLFMETQYDCKPIRN